MNFLRPDSREISWHVCGKKVTVRLTFPLTRNFAGRAQVYGSTILQRSKSNWTTFLLRVENGGTSTAKGHDCPLFFALGNRQHDKIIHNLLKGGSLLHSVEITGRLQTSALRFKACGCHPTVTIPLTSYSQRIGPKMQEFQELSRFVATVRLSR